MTQSHWSDYWVDRLREVLPVDLENRPIYILAQSEIPAEFHTKGVRAWTSCLLDQHMKPILELQNRWQGNGLSMVIVDADVIQGDLSDGFAVLLHEIGHCLEAESKYVTRWQVNFAPELGPIFAAQYGKPVKIQSLFPGRVFPAWQDHGLDWIRASLHLHFRAMRRGWLLTPSSMSIAGDFRGLSDGMLYRERLLSELESEQDVPVIEILQRPAPGLTDLWIQDTQAIIRSAQHAEIVWSSMRPARLQGTLPGAVGQTQRQGRLPATNQDLQSLRLETPDD
ncbi:MAG: hypothetical protein WCJ09_23165 [Planctomycetota bacterium]